MKASTLLTLPFAALALAKAIPDRASFYERAASPQVPESTPTGSLCALVERDVAVASATIPSASEIASAVAGCIGVTPIGVTENDIVNGVCKPFTLIFARGTTETGNIGELVGPPFALALKEAFGINNVAVQGVNNYPALVQQTMEQCPTTKLCISGYSQGAQLVHNAADILKSNSNATNFINSVVTFGDPDQLLPVGNVPSSKVSIVCHAGDNICADGEEIKLEHLTYCENVEAEAAFALARSQAMN